MSCELLRRSCCIHLALFFVIESLVLATFIAVDHNDSKMRRHDTTAAVTCPDQFFLLLAQLHSCEMPPRVCCPVPICLLINARRDPSGPTGLPDLLEPKTSSTCFPAAFFVSPAFSSAVWRGASRILLRAALRRCGGASVCTAASGTRLQQAARHAKQVLLSHPLARRANEQRATFALPRHVQNDHVMATRAIRNFPVTVSRCSSNRTGHARCRAQRSLHSRRFLIGRRQAACQCASDERKGECVA